MKALSQIFTFTPLLELKNKNESKKNKTKSQGTQYQ